jgi:hypothetical protein
LSFEQFCKQLFNLNSFELWIIFMFEQLSSLNDF